MDIFLTTLKTLFLWDDMAGFIADQLQNKMTVQLMTSPSVILLPVNHTQTCFASHFNTMQSPTKDTVSKEGKHDEVDGRPHAVMDSTLRANPIVHHLVPVLTC